ncbi:centrosomal protein of 83 kDa [Octopus bimaculoides]|nr:centrosomal protein of 83 kDa [Octopus bimaculoides]|eukprot:XP_014783416.1 PREDICTED: centrosomal protein of 83 kDa-like [Octopus bimaculoides]
MEIFKLKCSENNYTEKLELFQQQTINLQNQITDYKHKIQVKESVIEPLLRQLERHRKFGLDEMQDTREKINALQSKNNQLVQDLAKHEDKTNEYLELENQIKEIQKEQRTLTQKQSSYKEDWEKQNKKMQIELDDFRNNMIRDLKNVWKQKEREYKEKIAELESNLKKEREISREYISRFDNNIGSIRCLHENLKDQIQAFL